MRYLYRKLDRLITVVEAPHVTTWRIRNGIPYARDPEEVTDLEILVDERRVLYYYELVNPDGSPKKVKKTNTRGGNFIDGDDDEDDDWDEDTDWAGGEEVQLGSHQELENLFKGGNLDASPEVREQYLKKIANDALMERMRG